jgi:hypothetical protein
MAHGKHTQAGEDDDDSLGELNGGDSAHAFDVCGIVDSGMRDYGMHFEKNRFPVSSAQSRKHSKARPLKGHSISKNQRIAKAMP